MKEKKELLARVDAVKAEMKINDKIFAELSGYGESSVRRWKMPTQKAPETLERWLDSWELHSMNKKRQLVEEAKCRLTNG